MLALCSRTFLEGLPIKTECHLGLGVLVLLLAEAGADFDEAAVGFVEFVGQLLVSGGGEQGSERLVL